MKVNFEKYKKYVAYIDVLGYSNLLLNQSINDQVRIHTLYEIWENLVFALDEVEKNFSVVEKILFSDSIYFASADIINLVSSLVDLYTQISVYYEHDPSSNSWMPMMRSGLSYNWVININDPTLSTKLKDSKHQFRNPAGPAIAEAYYLSEESGFKGMRILVPEGIKNEYLTSCGNYQADVLDLKKYYCNKLSQQEWPIAMKNLQMKNGKEFDVYDLPWWWGFDDQYPLNFKAFERHKWQMQIGNTINNGNNIKNNVLKHYTETERLFRDHALRNNPR